MTEISKNPESFMRVADLHRSEAPPPLPIPFIVRKFTDLNCVVCVRYDNNAIIYNLGE